MLQMKRPAIAIVALAAAGIAFMVSRRAPEPEQAPVTKADSVWYHASDVAQLANTGRPQLVEFFHPG